MGVVSFLSEQVLGLEEMASGLHGIPGRTSSQKAH